MKSKLTNSKKLNSLLPLIEKRIRELFGEKVMKIILFGSYARGDYNNESDVDIFVLVNDDDLSIYRKKRVNIITEFLETHEILVSIRITNDHTFSKYKDVISFYKNVITQGINLYG
ncbi:MAG: nucleotidyltransferase domain-containing protein [Ignavibacteriaceae bacterium]